MKKIQLLVIDPQIDFCDPKGALYVSGGEKDMHRLAEMVRKHAGAIDDIRVTLDSHQELHIAHPIMWVDSKGNHPAPFTLIQEDDVIGSNPKWKAFNPGFQQRQADYIKTLKANGKYVLCIWPPHCRIGSIGTAVYPEFYDALVYWQNSQFGVIDWITKGSNIFTEHYGAVCADVIDPSDPTTNINTSFIKRLEEADRILVAGEASSHCVVNSIKQVIQEFGEENAKKFVLLEDCMSPVTGFENLAEDFFNYAKSLGIQISTSTTFFK